MTPEETKELILFAAKAMDLTYETSKESFIPFILRGGEDEKPRLWNPLTSLSDRAAMCDQLEISTSWLSDGILCEAFDQQDKLIACSEPYGTNKSNACSLACLRVAAEIGRLS